jgi:hypothetical protein
MRFDFVKRNYSCKQAERLTNITRMNMTPRFQKFALLTHITFSVGWFSAVVPYLALVIAGLTSRDIQVVRAACLSMELIGWYAIVPFSFAALLSGLVMSLGSQWGLFRHWWILAKFLLTMFAIFVLFRHMQDVSRMAKETMLSSADFRPDFIHATGGLLMLLAAMTLSVFKPWGMTPYGRRRASPVNSQPHPSEVATPVREPAFVTHTARWTRMVGIHVAHAAVIVLLFAAVLHLTSLHHH